ncbi:MAG TPA: dihydrofolate reductase family protein [Opitutaceae bacterium]|jgi:dihydrofolate reductase
MRNLILKISTTADGFVCGPKGELDWLFRRKDDAAAAWTVDIIWQGGAHLMGSRTYQDMVAYWPYSDEVYAPPMNAIPKIVFTRKGTLERPSPNLTSQALRDAEASQESTERKKQPDPAVLKGWLEPEFLGSDLADDIDALKKRPGKDLIAHGGAGFAQSLVELGLVDKFCLLVHPIAIGAGRPLFGTLAKPMDLELIDLRPFPSGAIAKVYRPVDRSP